MGQAAKAPSPALGSSRARRARERETTDIAPHVCCEFEWSKAEPRPAAYKSRRSALSGLEPLVKVVEVHILDRIVRLVNDPVARDHVHRREAGGVQELLLRHGGRKQIVLRPSKRRERGASVRGFEEARRPGGRHAAIVCLRARRTAFWSFTSFRASIFAFLLLIQSQRTSGMTKKDAAYTLRKGRRSAASITIPP